MNSEKFTNLTFEIIDNSGNNFLEKHQLLQDRLREYNATVMPNYKVIEKLFLFKDDCEQLIAGLYGYHSFGRFCIDLLWVADDFRKERLGTKLLENLEQYAFENKILYIRVNTATFQALDFYLKNGYEILTKLPLQTNYDEQQYDHYLIKYIK